MPKRIKILIGLLAIILLVFLLNFFQEEIKPFFYFISSPFQKVLWKTGDSGSDFISGLLQAGKLKKQADELTSENQRLLAEITILNELKRENEFLRETLALGMEKEFKLSLARIISKDISQDFILIDKGLNSGLSENMPVITEEKVILGRISEVYDNFSKVMLISNKKSFFDVEVSACYGYETEQTAEETEQGPKNICGILKGEGNFKVFLDLIPQDEEISQGDIITTSSLGGVFPPGLLVGEITEIKKNDVESFQQAEIKPAFDIRKMNYLFVIIEY